MSYRTEALVLLKNRIANDGELKQVKTTDGYAVLVDASLFSDDQLNIFLDSALMSVNCFVPFTSLSFDDDNVKYLIHYIVQMAVVQIMFSMSLIEKGREFSVKDNGIDYESPKLSGLLFQAYMQEKNDWYATITDAKLAIVAKINQSAQ